MKKLLIYALLFVFAISACAPAVATPTVEPVNVDATIAAHAAEYVAGTLTAMPTNTPLPTETPTSTPEPTFTPEPTATETATVTPTVALFIGSLESSDTSGLPKGLFVIFNEAKSPAVVTIQGVTQPGEKAVYYSWLVEKIFKFDIPFGSYTYYINVSDKKIFTGSFRINNYDKTEMHILLTKVNILGP